MREKEPIFVLFIRLFLLLFTSLGFFVLVFYRIFFVTAAYYSLMLFITECGFSFVRSFSWRCCCCWVLFRSLFLSFALSIYRYWRRPLKPSKDCERERKLNTCSHTYKEQHFLFNNLASLSIQSPLEFHSERFGTHFSFRIEEKKTCCWCWLFCCLQFFFACSLLFSMESTNLNIQFFFCSFFVYHLNFLWKSK